MRQRKHLLIAFDAFGTLFSPRAPIAIQYVEVARRFGITELKSEDVESAFKKAFKEESSRFPNYGKKTGMDPEIWWASVITKTFTPLLSTVNCDKLENVVPALLERFSSSDGYVLHPDARSLLESLRESRSTLLGTAPKSTDGDLSRTIVGIISNSDPRVPNILRSFGLKVGPLHVQSTDAYTPGPENFDLDFTVLSYDAGFAKPDPKIFHAAESLVRRSLLPDNEMDELLTKLYVGDEFDNDGIAAVRAGWNAVIVDREGVLDEHFHNPVLKFPSGVDEKNTEGPVRTVERVTTLWPWNPFALRETV